MFRFKGDVQNLMVCLDGHALFFHPVILNVFIHLASYIGSDYCTIDSAIVVPCKVTKYACSACTKSFKSFMRVGWGQGKHHEG